VVTAEGIIAPRSEERDNKRVKTPTLSKKQRLEQEIGGMTADHGLLSL